MATNHLRDKTGSFCKRNKSSKRGKSTSLRQVLHDHSYGEAVQDAEIRTEVCRGSDEWKTGRRVVELGVLLNNLLACKCFRLGPVPLTIYNVVGELKKGPSGYLYVQCMYSDCGYINCVAYRKTHRVKARGMPCYAPNTKLGTAMIDNTGGADRVNNFISTLNINTISNPSLKKRERHAGSFVETVPKQSCHKTAKETFDKEQNDVALEESAEAELEMEGLIPDLGVAALPDST